jgi:hypothetical protein
MIYIGSEIISALSWKIKNAIVYEAFIGEGSDGRVLLLEMVLEAVSRMSSKYLFIWQGMGYYFLQNP